MTIFGACFLIVLPGTTLPPDVKVGKDYKVLVAVLFSCTIGDQIVTVRPEEKKGIRGAPWSIPIESVLRIENHFGKVLWHNNKLSA